MDRYDRVQWALSVNLPRTRSVGENAIGRVLVAMANNTDDLTGETYISIRTLENDISGLTRRDVHNAQKALEECGIIRRAGTSGRKILWVVGPEAAAMAKAFESLREESRSVRDIPDEQGAFMSGGMSGELSGGMSGELSGISRTYMTVQDSAESARLSQVPHQGPNEISWRERIGWEPK